MRNYLRWLLAVFSWLFLSTTAFGQQQALLLFGGRDHDQFLGCLNSSCAKALLDVGVQGYESTERGRGRLVGGS